MWKILVLLAVFLVIQDTDGFWWRRRRYVHTKTACEHRRMILNCGRHRYIRVHYAAYGRQNSRTCSRKGASHCSTRCRSRKSLFVVKRLCNGKSRCSIKASNSVFGDPCKGTYKYLRVKYYCKKRRFRGRDLGEEDKRETEDVLNTEEDVE
ncbi:L-rhamnose-binding lectin ELEL-1-like [Saccostrea echinata]|uniref:L-rhamnose-binding lectin ELEL-1-like n=1 Tax=Saccostrea echinata TaxID=191078 RepID=UPI002A816210|nr:L-rhamnose-binding lectin ELEL-1-like [Saccostrea echinata]